MIDYKIIDVRRAPETGEIREIVAKAFYEADGVKVQKLLNPKFESSENFTPFDQMSKEDVIAKLESAYEEGYIESFLIERHENKIASQERQAQSLVGGIPSDWN